MGLARKQCGKIAKKFPKVARNVVSAVFTWKVPFYKLAQKYPNFWARFFKNDHRRTINNFALSYVLSANTQTAANLMKLV